MTLDISRLQALHDAATPGEWVAYDPGDGTARLYGAVQDPEDCDDEQGGQLLWKGVGPKPGYYSAAVYMERADGELIVAARNALPALLAVVAERDKLAAKIKTMRMIADSGSPTLTCYESEIDPEGGVYMSVVVDHILDRILTALDGAA